MTCAGGDGRRYCRAVSSDDVTYRHAYAPVRYDVAVSHVRARARVTHSVPTHQWQCSLLRLLRYSQIVVQIADGRDRRLRQTNHPLLLHSRLSNRANTGFDWSRTVRREVDSRRCDVNANADVV